MTAMRIKDIFNDKSFQRHSSIAALVIGGAGILSGVFLAASGNVAALGILPSAAMFALGCLGLRGLSKPSLS
jgi:hypothetical protein